MGGAASLERIAAEAALEKYCSSGRGGRERVLSYGTARDLLSDLEVCTMRSECQHCTGVVEALDITSCSSDLSRYQILKIQEQPFAYEGKAFCGLPCFFKFYSHKPCLCHCE